MKIWFAFGDSITDMGYYIPTVCKETGLQGYKFGYSGYALGEDPAGYGSLSDAVNDMLISEVIPDIVTIFGGTNDFGHGGSMEAMEKGLHEIITKIKTQWPETYIMVLTPLQRNYTGISSWETHGLGPNQIGLYMNTYVDKIIEVSEQEHVELLDLYHTSGLTEENASEYTLDGLHPNEKFSIKLGKQIADTIKKYFY